MRMCRITAQEALDEITDNEELKDILSYIVYIDMGKYI